MHFTADAVAGQVADHTAAMALGPALNGMAHIAQAVSRNGLAHALPEALLSDLDQRLGLGGDFAHAHGKGTVSLPAIQHKTAVDADDGAFLQNLLFGRNTVDHLVIHAGAQGGGVSFIVQEGGCGMVLADQLLGIHIQGSGTHTGLDSLAQLLQHLVEEGARLAHFPDLVGIFNTNHC